MKIRQRAILGLACSILLLNALLTTAVYAMSPEIEPESTSQEDQKLTPEEVKAWMDENQIEYTVRSEQTNSYRPTRAELAAWFLNDESQSRNSTSSSWAWESFSEPLSDFDLASGDQWQSHFCKPEGKAFLKMGGQTLTGIRDGGLYYFDHRREYFRTNDPTPLTYTNPLQWHYLTWGRLYGESVP